MTVTHNLVSYIVIKIANAQLQKKSMQKKSNRSYLYKSFHIRRSTDALSRQFAGHNVSQIHNIAQHEMVLDVQKTNTLQQLISQEQNYKCNKWSCRIHKRNGYHFFPSLFILQSHSLILLYQPIISKSIKQSK